MTTTIFTTFKMTWLILLAVSMILFLAVVQFAQAHLADTGWQTVASISWNG